MSFFKKLFGRGGGEHGASGSWTEDGVAADAVEHEGFTIEAKPIKEGGQFRLAGTISKEIDGKVWEHNLIRADMFPDAEQCREFTVRKAKQVIKEQGDALFRHAW